MTLFNALNSSLWGSGTRIHAAYKLRYLGELHEEPILPPDVAQVIDELGKRELNSFAEVVSLLRPIDAEVTERYRTQLAIPTGGSVFDPVYSQYIALEAAPVMAEREELIWQAMPAEWRLLNRYAATATTDPAGWAVLQDLYGDVDKRIIAGSSAPFVADNLRAQQAIDTRKLLYGEGIDIFKNPTSKVPFLGIPLVVWGIVGIVAAGVAVVTLIPAIGKYLEAGATRAALDAALVRNEQAYRYNGQVADYNLPLINYCLQYATANGKEPSYCADFQRSLPQFSGPIDPGESAARALAGLTCNADSCWAWIGTGVVIGALAAFLAARRLAQPRMLVA